MQSMASRAVPGLAVLQIADLFSTRAPNDTTLRSPDHLKIQELGALRPSKCLLMSERSLASVEIRKSLPSVQLTGELKQRNSWRLDCCEPSFPVSPLHSRSLSRALITVSEEAGHHNTAIVRGIDDCKL